MHRGRTQVFLQPRHVQAGSRPRGAGVAGLGGRVFAPAEMPCSTWSRLGYRRTVEVIRFVTSWTIAKKKLAIVTAFCLNSLASVQEQQPHDGRRHNHDTTTMTATKPREPKIKHHRSTRSTKLLAQQYTRLSAAAKTRTHTRGRLENKYFNVLYTHPRPCQASRLNCR